MKKTNILLFILTLLASIFILLYYIFNSFIKEFVDELPLLEAIEYQKHLERKKYWEEIYTDSISQKRIKDYSSTKNKKGRLIFKNNENNSGGLTDFNDAIIERDTTVNFLFFFKTLSYQSYDEKYFECLCYHKINRWLLLTDRSKTETVKTSLKNELKIKANEYDYLVNLINRNKKGKIYFPLKSDTNKKVFDCHKVISTYSDKKIIDELSVKEFKYFYEKYKSDKKENPNNKINQKRNNQLYKKYSKGLNSFLKKKIDVYWKNNFSKKMILKEFIYEGKNEGLGEIKYSFEENITPILNEEDLIKYIKKISSEYYETNSLITGSTPYSYCYGKNPNCSPPDGYSMCSFIAIKASFNSDLIAVIKKNNRVYSHAYIKAGSSYKFKLGNGRFQAFFYYGKGWNPEKYIKNANCGKIIGGFVSNESLNKTDVITLNNSSITYTLNEVENGNFSPEKSNVNEVF